MPPRDQFRFNHTLSIYDPRNRIRRGSLGVETWFTSTTSCGSIRPILFLLKISQMVISPVRGTYNEVDISLLWDEKKSSKVASLSLFLIAKSYICLILFTTFKKFNVFSEFVRW